LPRLHWRRDVGALAAVDLLIDQSNVLANQLLFFENEAKPLSRKRDLMLGKQGQERLHVLSIGVGIGSVGHHQPHSFSRFASRTTRFHFSTSSSMKAWVS